MFRALVASCNPEKSSVDTFRAKSPNFIKLLGMLSKIDEKDQSLVHNLSNSKTFAQMIDLIESAFPEIEQLNQQNYPTQYLAKSVIYVGSFFNSKYAFVSLLQEFKMDVQKHALANGYPATNPNALKHR